MPAWSSSALAVEDHADACDDGDRSWPSGLEASPVLSSSARQRPLADGQDHQGATSLGASGADRSSASSSPWRCCRATTGSRSGLPLEPSHGSPSRGFAVSTSAPPCRRQIHEMASIGKDRPVPRRCALTGVLRSEELLTRLLGGSAAVMPRDVTAR